MTCCEDMENSYSIIKLDQSDIDYFKEQAARDGIKLKIGNIHISGYGEGNFIDGPAFNCCPWCGEELNNDS